MENRAQLLGVAHVGLYAVARRITNEAGLTWYDPVSGRAYPPRKARP